MNKFTRSIQAKIVRIGNSQGIRIPHALLQQLHLTRDVEMSVQDDQLIIRAARTPRAGWEARFARAASQPMAGLPDEGRADGDVEASVSGDAEDWATEWDGAGLAW
jgi:antitoxin MazE